MKEGSSPFEEAIIEASETGSDVEYVQKTGDLEFYNKRKNKQTSQFPFKTKNKQILERIEPAYYEETEDFLSNNREEIERKLEIDLMEERNFEQFKADLIELATKTELAAKNLKRIIKQRKEDIGEDISPEDPLLGELYNQYYKIEWLVQELHAFKIMNGEGYSDDMFVRLKKLLDKMQEGYGIVSEFGSPAEIEAQIGAIEREKDNTPTQVTENKTIQDTNHEWEISQLIKINVSANPDEKEELTARMKALAVGVLAHQKNLAGQIGSFTNPINGSVGKKPVKTDHTFVIDQFPPHKQMEYLLGAVFDITRAGVTSALAKNHLIGLAAAEKEEMEREMSGNEKKEVATS